MVSELLEDVSLETIAEKDLMESTQGKERRGFDRNNFSAIHETQLLLVLVATLCVLSRDTVCMCSVPSLALVLNASPEVREIQ